MPRTLTSLRVTGLRSLKDVTLELGRTTVLIGANGAGKSQLLAALQMVTAMRDGALGIYVAQQGGAAALLHDGPQATPAITLHLEFADAIGASTYAVRLGHAAPDDLTLLDEQGRTGADAWLARIACIHIRDASALRQPSRDPAVRGLRPDGSNLAGFLLRLAQSKDDAARAAWIRINALVRRVAPSIGHLEPTLVEPHLGPESAVRLDWVDDRGHRFGASQLSDATLRAVALISVLAQPVETLPLLLAIDEPELGLHPAALSLLAGLIKSVAHHCQVLLATQSPTLLDCFDVADVVVAERNGGATQLTRLDEAKLAVWLADYSLSDVWDKNLIGGRS